MLKNLFKALVLERVCKLGERCLQCGGKWLALVPATPPARVCKHVLVLVALTAFAGITFSTVSAQEPQAVATATAEPSDVAPAVQTPTPPRLAPPAVAINPLALLRRLGLVGGVVVANNGNSLRLRLGQTTRDLQIASTTLLIVPGIKNAQTSDIQVGDRVVSANRDKSAPSLVLDFPKGYTADNVVLGLVQLNASGLSSPEGIVMLRTRSGPQKITVTDSTIILSILGNQPTLVAEKDIRRGDIVIVIGQKKEDQFDPQVILVFDRAALQDIRRQNQPTPTPTP